MARRVIHYSTWGRDAALLGIVPKTFCGRVMTARYGWASDTNLVTCPRCIGRLNKKGMLPAPTNRENINGDINTTSNSEECDIRKDGDIDLYLKRLGIL